MPDDEELIADFQLKYVTYYDGSGHRLGSARCTLTNRRLIIDAQGGVHQVQLRDIGGVQLPQSSLLSKSVNIQLRGRSGLYQLDCRDRNQLKAVIYSFQVAIQESHR